MRKDGRLAKSYSRILDSNCLRKVCRCARCERTLVFLIAWSPSFDSESSPARELRRQSATNRDSQDMPGYNHDWILLAVMTAAVPDPLAQCFESDCCPR